MEENHSYEEIYEEEHPRKRKRSLISRAAPYALGAGSLYLLYTLVSGPLTKYYTSAVALYRGAETLYRFFKDPISAIIKKGIPPPWNKGGAGSGGGRGGAG